MNKLKKIAASAGTGGVAAGGISLAVGTVGLAVAGTAIAITFPVAVGLGVAFGLATGVGSLFFGNDKKIK